MTCIVLRVCTLGLTAPFLLVPSLLCAPSPARLCFNQVYASPTDYLSLPYHLNNHPLLVSLYLSARFRLGTRGWHAMGRTAVWLQHAIPI